VVLDDLSSGSRDNLDPRVTFIEASVLDIAEHAAALEGVERVYHFAAMISGRDSLYEPEAYQEVNGVGLLRLIDWVKDKGARVIFASSSTVYGNGAPAVKTEDTPAAPLSIYALTKYTGEHTLALYEQMHGIDWVALRLFNVYGPRQSENHPYANVTCKFAHAAATGAGVRLYGDGSQSRDFIHVNDVVDAFLLVADGSAQRIYNVGTGRDASILRLLEIVHELADEPLAVEKLPPWPNDIQKISADVSRLADELGFSAQVSLEDGLAQTVAWFREREGS